MRFYITSFNIMQNYIISGQIQECPIKLKQTMAATKSLCEFYGGQFFRKMIHSFLNLIYSPSARLASAMQIVTELCLTDTCKFFQTSKREYPGISKFILHLIGITGTSLPGRDRIRCGHNILSERQFHSQSASYRPTGNYLCQ